MTTAFLTHPDALAHKNPPGHPERIERLEAILDRMTKVEYTGLQREEAPLCSDDDILLCHLPPYLERVVEAAPQGAGWVPLDSDTHLNKGTLNAARRGVGGNLKAVDMVLDGAVQNAFVAMRPPGHHAERDTAMGFCFFGNAAIAAKHALDRRGLSRVAIVDFDVHHGNGTQDLLWDEPRALFISTHQMPLYPGTGVPNEKGAHGQIVNVPLRTGTGTKAFQTAWNAHVQPALEAHEPELIFISAGFDAHMADPLAELHLLPDDFAWATEQICNVADRYAQGRIVSTLEGGYDLQGLADSVEAHLTVLMERGEKNE